MLIDWFTVGAQTLNFLILVWLLKRFLYKPILDAIDGREKSIAKKLTDASEKKAEAVKERAEFEQKNVQFERQRAALLSQATVDAQAERQRLLDAARVAADALRIKQQAALKSEEQGLHDQIVRRTHEEVFAITRKTLLDLAGTTLEERMTEVFVLRLRSLDGAAKDNLVQLLKTASVPVRVRSAFDLPPVQQAALQQALGELLSPDRSIHFETVPGMVSGIELGVNGTKIAWNVTDYLAQMEKSVAASMAVQSEPSSKPDGKLDAKPEVNSESKSEGEK
ncbi:MAG: F-type H+-transporting ATPase subunit b [Janthinobacterium sp.]|jgi:F-type H+-transporting ATPase subunit b